MVPRGLIEHADDVGGAGSGIAGPRVLHSHASRILVQCIYSPAGARPSKAPPVRPGALLPQQVCAGPLQPAVLLTVASSQ